jgi:hypothetical protein
VVGYVVVVALTSLISSNKILEATNNKYDSCILLEEKMYEKLAIGDVKYTFYLRKMRYIFEV